MTRIAARPETVVGSDDATTAAVNPEGSAAKSTETKKGPPSKDPHPSVAAGTKLTEVPDDFDPKKHSALKEEDFDPSKLNVYYSMKAGEYRKRADQWDRKAKDFERLGAITDKKAAQKALDHMSAMRKSLETLIAQGEDMSNFPAAMLAACGIEVPPKTEG